MCKKLFSKKKNKEYFVEIENKTPAKTSEVQGETVATSVESKSSYAVSNDPPEWVKAIKNYSNVESKSDSENKGSGFASNYLMTNVPLIRRRPGPSLNSFKQMARTIKG